MSSPSTATYMSSFLRLRPEAAVQSPIGIYPSSRSSMTNAKSSQVPIHHRLAAAPPQEVAFGGGAEGPHVAVVSVLPPAGLIGVGHRRASHRFLDVGQRRLGLLGHPVGGDHDGPHAKTQPVHRVQIPLDDAERQLGFLQQRGGQGEQIGPQTLLPQRHTL